MPLRLGQLATAARAGPGGRAVDWFMSWLRRAIPERPKMHCVELPVL